MSGNEAVEQARRWLAERGAVPPGDFGAGPAQPPTRSPAAPQQLPRERPSTNGGDRRRQAGPESGTDSDPDAGPDADPESVARAIVFRKLAARAHSRAELERALTTRKVPDDAISTVLDRMVELGLVDDELFARDWVESRQQRRHLSRLALQQELTRKGIDRETIAAAVQELDGDDELAAARALVDKKRPSLDRLDSQVRYRRLAGALGRRGFSPWVIATVLAEPDSS